jgi:hypothetical protein
MVAGVPQTKLSRSSLSESYRFACKSPQVEEATCCKIPGRSQRASIRRSHRPSANNAINKFYESLLPSTVSVVNARESYMPQRWQRRTTVFQWLSLSSQRHRRRSIHTGCFSTLVSTGIFRKRLPVAAKIALATAGTIAEVPASPMPPGASELWTICTSIAGASFMRSIW